MMPGMTMLALIASSAAAAFNGHRFARVEAECSVGGWVALGFFILNAVFMVALLVTA